ncbi:MAG TPA: YbjN domain-containing protein [Dermatophilaceae bacterium]|nr:YbjN domain-containing protein [Dermatophilaceae bacterium]
MTTAEQAHVVDLITRFATQQELELDLGTRPGELVVVLPGEKKLKTVCSILVGDTEMVLGAFVIRNPDENHAKVYRYLLRRNLRMPGLAYAVDAMGDVYVVAHVPLRGIGEAYLDRLFGVVLEAADSSFNELLALGFLESMRKEWAWRQSRNESLANLQAFRHLLEDTSDEAPPLV